MMDAEDDEDAIDMACSELREHNPNAEFGGVSTSKSFPKRMSFSKRMATLHVCGCVDALNHTMDYSLVHAGNARSRNINDTMRTRAEATGSFHDHARRIRLLACWSIMKFEVDPKPHQTNRATNVRRPQNVLTNSIYR